MKNDKNLLTDKLTTLVEKKQYQVSNFVISDFLAHENASASTRLVYELLESLTSSRPGGFTCTQDYLSSETSLNVRTIRRAIHDLEDLGLLDCKAVTEFNRRVKTTYRLKLTSELYEKLKSKSSNKRGCKLYTVPRDDFERKELLDKQKMFVRINYKMRRAVLRDSQLTAAQKIVWLNFYRSSYAAYMKNGNFGFYYKVSTLSSTLNIAKSSIRDAIKALKLADFLQIESASRLQTHYAFVRVPENELEFLLSERDRKITDHKKTPGGVNNSSIKCDEKVVERICPHRRTNLSALYTNIYALTNIINDLYVSAEVVDNSTSNSNVIRFNRNPTSRFIVDRTQHKDSLIINFDSKTKLNLSRHRNMKAGRQMYSMSDLNDADETKESETMVNSTLEKKLLLRSYREILANEQND